MLECAIHPITYRGEGILATIVKNVSISNSILITNAIPAEGIPNCANKMV